MRGTVSEGTYIDDHPAAGEPPQPPLGEQPSIHPSASVRASTFGPWTAVGPRSQVAEATFGAFSYVVNDSDIIYATRQVLLDRGGRALNPGNHPMWRASQHHLIYRAASYRLGDGRERLLRLAPAPQGDDRTRCLDRPWRDRHAGRQHRHRRRDRGRGRGRPRRRAVHDRGGVPARPIRERFDAATTDAAARVAWWEWSREQLRAALPDFRQLSVEAFIARYGSRQAVCLNAEAAVLNEGGVADGCRKTLIDTDPERFGADRRRPLGEDRQHPVALGRLQPLGQRHVEAEVVEDVRIAVAQQVAVLARREAARPPARDLGLIERGAKRIERLDAAGRERLERRRRCRRECQEAVERTHLQPDLERFAAAGEGLDRLVERIRRDAVGERERRLQRAMKP